jgi:hypothetical protein
LKENTTIKYESAAAVGGMLEKRRGGCGACGGTLSLRYGQQFEGQKKPKILYTVALDGHWSINLHTTTNQKQAPIMEESKDRRGDRRGSAGGCKSIVLGAIAVK